MVGHGGSSAASYLADPTSPIPSHCASIVMTSTLTVKISQLDLEVWCSETLPDAPSILGNLARISVELCYVSLELSPGLIMTSKEEFASHFCYMYFNNTTCIIPNTMNQSNLICIRILLLVECSSQKLGTGLFCQ